MKDSYGDGWGSSNNAAHLSLYLGGARIFWGNIPYLVGRTSTSVIKTFEVSVFASPLSEWKYTDVPQTSNAWTQSNFNDAGWSTAAAGSFSDFTATTRYYRFTGSLTNRATIPAIYASINTTYGFVHYVQGTEVYRYYMPSGDISPTTASTEAYEPHYVAVSSNKFLLPASGSFVIAYEVHLPSGVTGGADPFSCIGNIYTSGQEGSYGISNFYGGIATSTPAGQSTAYDVSKLFDHTPYSYYYTTTSNAPVFTYQFSNGRAEWLNYYSLTSARYSTYGNPSDWTLYGSNDGTTWDTLDVQEGITFATTSVIKYFSLRSNPKSYNQYKLEITSCSVSGKCGLGEFEGYTAIFASDGSNLLYDIESFSGYALLDSISAAPIVNGFSSFTVEPPFPNGITLNPNTGTITGTPTVGAVGTYTISAINFLTSQSSSTQLSLNIITCSHPQYSLVRFMKVSLSWANEESYTVTDVNGQTYNSPTFTNQATQYIHYCFPAGLINVHLADSYGDGWASGSRLHIQMSDYEGDYYTIASIFERRNQVNDFVYDVSYKLYPQSNTWTYSTNLVSNWYGSGAVTGFSTFDAANPPASNGKNVWFFRNTVSMSSTGYDGFEMRVKARAGYVVYVNGVEFIRKNLPAGDISTTTAATGGESTSTYRFISGPNSIFINGVNTVAVGIVNLASNNPTTVLFDLTLQQLKSNVLGRSFDVTLSDSPNGINLQYIHDLSTTTNYYNEHPSKADFIITYTYGAHRAEHFNKHCVTSSSTLTDAYDPSDWAIYGSNDGETFELLGNVTNAYFSERSTMRCFYMPNNKKAFNVYRMVITETAVPTSSPYGLALSELTFSMVDLDQLEVPAFSLDAPSYTGYVGVPFPEVTPSSDLFSDYSISPALELPLEIDTSTGSIRGVPNAIMPPTLYTISAKTPKGETVTTQVTLSVVNCEYPNNQFTILIQAGSAGGEMGFELKDATNSTLLLKNRFTNDQASYYPQCRPTGTYTLTLTDSGHDGWDTGYFRILLADESVVLFGSLGTNESGKDFKFYIGYLVTPIYSSYLYLNDGTAAPSDWTQIQSNAISSWQEAKPGEFGNFVGTTAYFRKTFDINNLDTYAALAFSVKTTYGVIVYINGKQVYSYNMPKGAVTSETKCLSKRNQAINVGSSIAIQYSDLVVGTNVACFEVHVADKNTTNVIDFDSTIQLTADGSYRVLDGTASSELEIDESVGKLFDNIKGTTYINTVNCVGATPTWTYNNDRREFISSYTIITGPVCNVRTPSGWRIEGSNDGVRWSVLNETTRQYFTAYGSEQTYHFYNRRVFNQYRMVTTDCSNGEINLYATDCSSEGDSVFQLSELGLYAKRLQAACEPTEDGFNGAVEGQYAYKDCEEYYQGRYQAMCTNGNLTNIEKMCSLLPVARVSFSSDYIATEQKRDFSYTPVVEGAEFTCTSTELPAGVSFDSNTGRLYGRHDLIASYTITVTCSNTVGSATTNVTLLFTEKTGLDLWVWIVIVVLAVIVLTIVIFFITNRMKSKKNRLGHKLDKRAVAKKTNANAKSNTPTKATKI